MLSEFAWGWAKKLYSKKVTTGLAPQEMRTKILECINLIPPEMWSNWHGKVIRSLKKWSEVRRDTNLKHRFSRKLAGFKSAFVLFILAWEGDSGPLWDSCTTLGRFPTRA